MAQTIRFQFNPETGILYAACDSLEPPVAAAGAAEAPVTPSELSGDSRPPLADEDFAALLLSEGYGALRRNGPALATFLDQYNAGRGVEGLPVAQAVDGEAQVSVSPDAMTAFLTLTRPEGGKAVDRAQVERALAHQGVRFGIDQDAIDQALTLVAAGEAIEGFVVARGQSAVPGEDGRFQCLLPDTTARMPQLSQSGRIDYRDLGQIPTVTPGAELMRRVQATRGVAGTTVTGLAIPAKPGKEMLYAPGLSGVQADQADPDLLRASVAGQPVRIANGIMVEPVLKLPEVSLATGNIDFDGTVQIAGDVHTGMRVRAAGDIEVGGTVEAASLEAGGDIRVKGGVIGILGREGGSSPAAATSVVAKGTVSATYAQQAMIEAGHSVVIEDVAMQCDLVAIQQIVVGVRKRGHLIGGRAQATLGIRARVIGSPAHPTTLLQIGVNPLLQRRLHQLENERHDAEARLDQLAKLLTLHARSPERVPADMAERARRTSLLLTQQLATLDESRSILEADIHLAAEAAVDVEQAVYEGVDILCAGQRHTVTGDLLGHARYRLDASGALIRELVTASSPGGRQK